MNLFARAKSLLVEPGKSWDAIAAEPMSLGGIFAGYVLPLAALPSIASAIGTFLAGNMPNAGDLVMSYAIAVLSVFLMGKLVPPLAAACGARADAISGMKLAAFAPTGAWVGGLALMVPSIGGLLALLGALYTLYLFFDGAARLLPAPAGRAKMLGLAMVLASILLNMLIGLLVGMVITKLA